MCNNFNSKGQQTRELIHPITFFSNEDSAEKAESPPGEESQTQIEPITFDQPLGGEAPESTVLGEKSAPNGPKGLINPITFNQPFSEVPLEPIVSGEKSAQDSPKGLINPITEVRGSGDLPLSAELVVPLRGLHREIEDAPLVDIIPANQMFSDIAYHSPNVVQVNLLAENQGQSLQIQTVPPLKNANFIGRSSDPRPYDLAQKMKQQHIFRAVNDCLYVYNGTHFQYLPFGDACRLITKTCEADVAQVGYPRIVENTYSFLLMDHELYLPDQRPDFDHASFLNGVLSLSDGVLLPHSPNFFSTWTILARYDPTCTQCPNFDGYLDFLTGSDPVLKERIWQTVGYCLVTDSSAKKLFLLQGAADSGKSKLIEVVISFFRSEVVISMDLDALGDRFNTAELAGKALCLSPDLPDLPLGPETVSTLKKLTGNDLVSGDVKHRARIKFYNTAKILAATNHQFSTKKRDDAFMDRVVVIPCKYRVPEETKNPHLLSSFEAEHDAIAMRAIAAYQRLRQAHYHFAGDYKINETLDHTLRDHQNSSLSLEAQIQAYLLKSFKQDPDRFVFVDDAYAEFCPEGIMPINTFSSYFFDSAQSCFGATKARKRKAGNQNPQSCILGICHI